MKQQTRKNGRTRTVRPTRQYTRGFTPADGIGSELKIRRIPNALKRQVMAKAKRDGVSVSGMLKTFLQEWVAK